MESSVSVPALQAFVAVADARSFHRAASELGYTQSAISHRIAVLESALGVPLFNRPGGRGTVTLTAPGEVAYRHARRALAAVDALAADARAVHHGRREVIRVGASQAAAAGLLPDALRRYRRDFPHVAVHLVATSRRGSVADAIARDRLDLALTVNPEPDERVRAAPIVDDPWVILTRDDDPIARAASPGFAMLDGVDLIAWHRDWATQRALEDVWRKSGIAPRIVFRTDDTHALVRMVAVGLGSACIGRMTAQRAIDGPVRWVQPSDLPLRRTLTLCTPRHRTVPEPVQGMIEAIRAAAPDGAR